MHHLLRLSAFLLIISLIACSPIVTETSFPTSNPTVTATPTTSLVLGNWHDMIYHAQVGRVVLVNGGPETGKPVTDPVELWSWDGQGWSLLSADLTGPRWRNFSSIAYDTKRDVLVLYGGLTADQDFQDTWEWDGEKWHQIPVEGPGPREAAGMAYDSERGKVVLFGGAQHGRMMNDTWEWDGVQWTNISNDGPSARFPAGFAYNATHKNVLLFGGHAFDGQQFVTYADTWIWNGTAWQQVASDGPSPRDGARAMYLPLSGEILLFGGAEIASSVTNLNDTWVWDGEQWEQLEVEGPPARVHPALAFDEARQLVLMTGGSNGPNSILADTWTWDGTAWKCVSGCE